MSLSSQILISLILGLGVGVFFGDLVTPVEIVGDAFIRLLQMTVLPYVAISLVVGLGSLRAEGAARLALRAGSVQLVLWGLAIATILVMPVAFPDWETASFFSTSLVSEDVGIDLLALFIPSNPFESLAQTIVPAVVVFSGALGIALIRQDDKRGLIHALETVKDALSSITTFVVRLAPVGVFAIAAYAAATIPIEQARSLQVYILSYSLLALVLTLWTLPGLVAAVTPYGWREIMRSMRGVLITALATGSVFVVLSVLVERTRAIVRSEADDPQEAGHFVDVVLPVAFTFPSAGKLLSLGFVLFAGWVAGYALSASQYPALVGAGVPSYFGATVGAIPFLLDLFQIPSDTFQLFLVADNMVGTRFGAMLGAMHLVAMGFLATAAMTGRLAIRPVALARYAIVTGVLTVGVLLGVRSLFSWVGHEYAGYDRFVSLEMRYEHPPMTVLEAPGDPDVAPRPGEDSVRRIVDRGTLRVGYTRDRLPWAFRNEDGALVGFDVEMARILAEELGVRLEIAPVDSPGLGDDLAAGRIDVLMSGIALTTSRLRDLSFSAPYTDETIAFIVRDHRRQDFGSRAAIRALRDPHIAVPDVPYYVEKLKWYLPDARLTTVASARKFFLAPEGTFDALLFTAESGSAWSLIYPQFTVAVPRPDILKVPLAYAVRRGDERLVEALSAWIELKRRDGTIEELFEHYVLGRMPESHETRWSVWRDVLGHD